MGCFDTIKVFMICPYCHNHQMLEAQTKDLGERMHTYTPLDEDWYNEKQKGFFGNERKFRKSLPVFNQFPYDKEGRVWKNQAERIEARAKVPEEFKHLKFVDVVADCHSIECQFDADRRDILWQGIPSGFGKFFDGKIMIKDGYLTGEVKDIEKRKGYAEKILCKYKIKYKKVFSRLMKKYRHEPIVCRNWHDEGDLARSIRDEGRQKRNEKNKNRI